MRRLRFEAVALFVAVEFAQVHARPFLRPSILPAIRESFQLCADVDEEKAEAYVRGTKLVPVDAVNLDFDAVALGGEYDDVLTEDDVVAVFSKKSPWDRQSVCRKARARAAAEAETARLESLGVRVEERKALGKGYHGCEGGCAHPGLVAVVTPYEWGERADVTFYCDDESHDYQPTPEEIETTEAFRKRCASLEAMGEHITEFAKEAFPKFPATGQAKLRQWAHEAFEAEYGCEPDDAWTGFKQPKGKALDQFVLMRAIPTCIPDIPERALWSDYKPWPYDLDDLLGFEYFPRLRHGRFSPIAVTAISKTGMR